MVLSSFDMRRCSLIFGEGDSWGVSERDLFDLDGVTAHEPAATSPSKLPSWSDMEKSPGGNDFFSNSARADFTSPPSWGPDGTLQDSFIVVVGWVGYIRVWEEQKHYDTAILVGTERLDRIHGL